MIRVAFVLLIKQYQTNQQLETDYRTSRKKHRRLAERNISVNIRKFESETQLVNFVYSLLKRE